MTSEQTIPEEPISADEARLRNRAVACVVDHLAAATPAAYALPLMRAFAVLRGAMLSARIRRLTAEQEGALLAALARIHTAVLPAMDKTLWPTVTVFLNAAATAVMSWRGDPRWPRGCAGVTDAAELLLAAEHAFASMTLFQRVVARELQARSAAANTKAETT